MINYCEYIDLEKDYIILVPDDEEHLDLLYRGDIFDNGELKSGFLSMKFHEDIYLYMDTKLFSFINADLDTLITMYEDEILIEEQLPQLLSLVKILIKNSDDEKFKLFAIKFKELVEFAIERNTAVGFWF